MDVAGGAELRIVDGDFGPRSATLTVISGGHRHSLRLIHPSPLSSLVEVFGECYEIRLVDQNADGANQLEYGRYRLEICDEDGPIAEAMADDYEIIAV